MRSEATAEQIRFMLIIALVAVQAGIIYLAFSTPRLSADVDSYLRLYRVRDLVTSWDWFSHTIAHMGPKEGFVSPWTRPVDMLLIPFAVLFQLFMPVDQAVMAAAYVVPPLVALATFYAVWRLADHRIDFSRRAVFITVLVLLTYPLYASIYIPLAVDHHGLIASCTIMSILLTMHIISDSDFTKAPYFLGGVMALGMWVSPEFMITASLILAALSINWLYRPAANHQYLWQIPLITGLLQIPFLLLERPTEFFVVLYDTISIVYIALWLVIAAAMFMLARFSQPAISRRLVVGVAAAAGAALLLLALFPKIYLLHFAEMSDALRDITAEQVPEQQSFWRRDRYFLWGIMALPLVPFLISLRRPSTSSLLLLQVAFVLLFVAASINARFYNYLIPVTALLSGYVSMPYFAHQAALRQKVFIALFILIVPYSSMYGTMILGERLNIPSMRDRLSPSCIPVLQQWLHNDASIIHDLPPGHIVTTPGLSGQVLYFTKHHHLSGYFHRIADESLAMHHFLSTDDLSKARQLTKDYNISYFLTCPGDAFVKPGTFWRGLGQANPPEWLEQITLKDARYNQYVMLYIVVSIKN